MESSEMKNHNMPRKINFGFLFNWHALKSAKKPIKSNTKNYPYMGPIIQMGLKGHQSCRRESVIGIGNRVKNS